MAARADSWDVLTTRRRAELIFGGQWAAAGVAPPYTSHGDRVQIVRRMVERTARPPWSDPIHYAVRDNLRVIDCVVPGVGCEYTDGQTVWFKWDPDRRVTGRRVAHGHAHCLLRDEGWFASEADAWLVTGEMLLPARLARRLPDLAAALERQPWACGWLLAAQMAFARRLFRAA